MANPRRGLEFLERAAELAETSSINTRNLEPMQLAAAIRTLMGQKQGRLGNTSAEADCYAEAVDLYSELVQQIPTQAAFRENLGIAKMDLGLTQLVNGQIEQATEQLQQSQTIFAELGQHFEVPAIIERSALATDNLAHAYMVAGNPEQAYNQSKAAQTTFNRLLNQGTQVPAYQVKLAIAESHAAQILEDLKEPARALEMFQSASERIESVAAEADVPVATHLAAATIHGRWGEFLWGQGEKEQAREQFQAAAEQFKLLAETSQDPQHHFAVAWFFLTCPDETLRSPLTALESTNLATEASPQNVRYQTALALYHVRKEEAQKAAAVIEALKATTDMDEARLNCLRVLVAQQQGEAEAAQQRLDEARDWIESHVPGDRELRRLLAECTTAVAP